MQCPLATGVPQIGWERVFGPFAPYSPPSSPAPSRILLRMASSALPAPLPSRTHALPPRRSSVLARKPTAPPLLVMCRLVRGTWISGGGHRGPRTGGPDFQILGETVVPENWVRSWQRQDLWVMGGWGLEALTLVGNPPPRYQILYSRLCYRECQPHQAWDPCALSLQYLHHQPIHLFPRPPTFWQLSEEQRHMRCLVSVHPYLQPPMCL